MHCVRVEKQAEISNTLRHKAQASDISLQIMEANSVEGTQKNYFVITALDKRQKYHPSYAKQLIDHMLIFRCTQKCPYELISLQI